MVLTGIKGMSKKSIQNKIPKFKTEDEEVAFWDNHDTSEYYDLTKMERVIFPNLKRTVKTISIRLPESMINSLKYLSNSLDIPYQSLIKQYLSETINRELHHPNRVVNVRNVTRNASKSKANIA